eukprot:CAMPEP_0197424090 /NCGR_PEP_ID=MMETSP1170-20131217/24637_1 /TAXON_ID=54406 /ORGANISM="Sarcinochrysis sp, Strain CCMP770" /LENGTH=72 /DNA_ID=CAMNT_0042951557 /DNA_START=16 /DNA_END=230 /DNA_ORIENTATION=-
MAQPWLVERIEREARTSCEVLSTCVEVREIMDEAIEDIEEAFATNAAMQREREFQVASLELDVARQELATVR